MNDTAKQNFLNSLLDDLRDENEQLKLLPAILTLDGQPDSTGLFGPEIDKYGLGQFQPTDGSNPDTTLTTQGTLKLSGRKQLLKVTNVQRCLKYGAEHYHLEYEVISQAVKSQWVRMCLLSAASAT